MPAKRPLRKTGIYLCGYTCPNECVHWDGRFLDGETVREAIGRELANPITCPVCGTQFSLSISEKNFPRAVLERYENQPDSYWDEDSHSWMGENV